MDPRNNLTKMQLSSAYGKFAKQQPIKLLIPHLPTADELLQYLRRIDAARWYTNFGPLNTELEERLSLRTGLPVCTVSSATMGLQLALQALDLPPRSNVLVPSFTYPATVCAIVNAGHEPVFCDVDPQTWCIAENPGPNSEEVAAVFPVCAFGASIPFISEMRYAGIPIITDAAAAFGNHKPNPDHLTVYSLHATKVPGAGEGGFVTGPKHLINTVRQLSNFGFGSYRQSTIAGGTNAKLSEYHAAIALASLDKLHDTEKRYARLCGMYVNALDEQFSTCDIQQRDGAPLHTSSFEVLLPRGTNIERIREFMGLRGIETRRWYFPLCHDMPAFLRYKRIDALPNSLEISARLLGLPFHLDLTEDDVREVCDTLQKAIKGANDN